MRILCLLIGAISIAVVLFNLVAYARRRSLAPDDCGADEALGAIDALFAFVGECLALFAVIALLPFGPLVGQRSRGLSGASATPIVLLHGWGLNAASLLCLRRRLERAGFGPVVIFSYATQAVDVEAAATRLQGTIDQLRLTTAAPITLIGHSLGGLVARYYLQHHPVDGIRRLVTIGTPHGGTALAPTSLPGVRRLHPESALIAQMHANDRVPDQVEVICIHSSFDALVLPAGNRDYRGAFNIEVRGVGHNALLFSPRVFALIAENLNA